MQGEVPLLSSGKGAYEAAWRHESVQLRLVRPQVCPKVRARPPPVRARTRTVLRVRDLRRTGLYEEPTRAAHEEAHGREGVQVRASYFVKLFGNVCINCRFQGVRQSVFPATTPESSRSLAFGTEAVQVRYLREVVCQEEDAKIALGDSRVSKREFDVPETCRVNMSVSANVFFLFFIVIIFIDILIFFTKFLIKIFASIL